MSFGGGQEAFSRLRRLKIAQKVAFTSVFPLTFSDKFRNSSRLRRPRIAGKSAFTKGVFHEFNRVAHSAGPGVHLSLNTQVGCTSILIASRPPAATQGFRDPGLANLISFTLKLGKRRARRRRRRRNRTRNGAARHETNKSNIIRNRLSPEGPRGVENESLEPSRAFLGAMWAQGGPRASPEAKVDRFQGPREVPGGFGKGSGEVFGVFFAVARRGGAKNNQKAINNINVRTC